MTLQRREAANFLLLNAGIIWHQNLCANLPIITAAEHDEAGERPHIYEINFLQSIF